MWLKTLGLILVIASCSGIGAEAVHRLRERLRLLETLRRRNRNSSCGLGKAWGTWIVICRKRQSYFIWKIWSIP